MKNVWQPGNRVRLLENGEAYYPRLFECIDAAQREILIETFILFDDKVGWALHERLLKAAQRGVKVAITVDGWGSPDLGPDFVDPLTAAGVAFHYFDPAPKLWRRLHAFRRLHRKIAVIDGRLAFIGGINYSADHLADFGPEAKQDYAVELAGPIVADIHRFTRSVVARPSAVCEQPVPPEHASSAQATARRHWWRRLPTAAPALAHEGEAEALFVTRDNRHHPTDIERHYRLAIRSARERVVIANAYFFPGYRLLRDLRKAAQRGVDVRLILQGQPDMAIVTFGARTLYPYLQKAGVKIYEYCRRPLHGKVALVDDTWSTVGSSNLDPLSLSLNLEANVVIRDAGFNAHLAGRLEALMQAHCRLVDPAEIPRRSMVAMVQSFLAFHLVRRFPSWARWLPPHREQVERVPPPSSAPAGTGKA